MTNGSQSRNLRHLGRRALILSLVSACLLPLSASAQETSVPSVLAWHCVQESDAAFHVLCVPRMAGLLGSPAPSAAAPGVNLKLLPVAQRGDAEVMSAEAWRIPLHVRPNDPSFVTTLLKSVLCGKRGACSVSYGEQGFDTATLRTASTR